MEHWLRSIGIEIIRGVRGAVWCGLEPKPQTAPHMRFELFGNRKPHRESSKPRYAVRFNAGGLCGLRAVLRFD